MDSPEGKNQKSKEKKLPTISPELEPTASTSLASRCNEQPSTNADSQTNQPNHVIKQIIALDSKELKGLGIESYILSAISKLNGTKCINESNENVQTTSNVSIKTEILSPNDKKSNEVPLIQPLTPDKKKKIEVLSQVVLNEDLKQFSANIAKRTSLSKTDTLIHPSQQFPPLKSENIDNVHNISETQNENTLIDSVNTEDDFNRIESPLDFEGFPPTVDCKTIDEILVQAITIPANDHVDHDHLSSTSDLSDLSWDELIERAKEIIDECEIAQHNESVDSSADSEDSSDDESIDNNFLDEFLNSTKQKFSSQETESDGENTQSEFQGRNLTNDESNKSPEPVAEPHVDEYENIVSWIFDKRKINLDNKIKFLFLFYLQKIEIISPEIQEDQNVVTNVDQVFSTPENPVIRTGRQRKQTTIEDFYYEKKPSTSSEVQIDTPKIEQTHEEVLLTPTKEPAQTKRRGRPKKSDVNITPLPYVPNEDEEPQSSETKKNNTRKCRLKRINESGTEIDVSSPADIVVPRKRGRKPKVEIQEASTSTPVATPETVSIETDISEDLTPKRRGRKPKHELLLNYVKKRGRPKACENNSIQTQLTNKVTIPTAYTCGNCKQTVPTKKWTDHVKLHYGILWRDGIDEPIDINDENAAAKAITRFLKIYKSVQLKCEKCGEKKRSGVGYISHIRFCGLSKDETLMTMVDCEYCGKAYRPASLQIHIQGYCPVLRAQRSTEVVEKKVKSPTMSREERKRQRKSYREAETVSPEDYIERNLVSVSTVNKWRIDLRDKNIIDCINKANKKCTYTASDINDMRTHLQECGVPEFHCTLCSFSADERNDVIEHVKSEHTDILKVDPYHCGDDKDKEYSTKNNESESSSSDSGEASDEESSGNDEEDLDGDTEKSQPRIKRKRLPISSLLEKDTSEYWFMIQKYFFKLCKHPSGHYPPALELTMAFINKNYYQNALTNELKMFKTPKVKVHRQVKDLLYKSFPFVLTEPSKYSEKFENIQDWNELKLFESYVNENNSECAFFCGGSAVAMEWVPLPIDACNGNQYLAICSKNVNASLTKLREHPSKTSFLIQLWRFSFNTDSSTITSCKFEYGIHNDVGPIYCMKFCPSDAYIDGKRLGILAIPTNCGNINLYSLPIDVNGIAKTNIITLQPTAVLRLSTSTENINEIVNQLSWQYEKGHAIIAAGYVNGLISIWNLNSLNSSYLCALNRTGVKELFPQRVFKASQSCITHLDIHSDHHGIAHWLLSGGIDRKVRIFDISETHPLEMSVTLFVSRITTGVWPLNWPQYITLNDNSMHELTAKANFRHIHNIFNIYNMPTNMQFEGVAYDIAFNSYLNFVAFGNDVGDLYLLKCRQLLNFERYDYDDGLNIISSVDFIETNKNERKFILNKFNKPMIVLKQERKKSNFKDLPHAAIVRLAFNPNQLHHKLLAIGYDFGICRIIKVD